MKKTFYKLATLSLLLVSPYLHAQTIHTIAGTGVAGNTGDGGAATSALIGKPTYVTTDATGNIYFADSLYAVIRKISLTGVITTVAGNGSPGFGGDGFAATLAQLSFPIGIAVDAAGNIYIGDHGNHRVRKVDATSGNISTYAGTGTPGSTGEGGPATAAELNGPAGLTLDAAGNLYIADQYSNRVRKVTAATGIIRTYAGCTGPTGIGCGVAGFAGDGGPATTTVLGGVLLYNPFDVSMDGAGNLYFSDKLNNRIRKVDALSGNLSTVVGQNSGGYAGDGLIASDPAVYVQRPSGVHIDAAGNVFLTDPDNNIVRKINNTSFIISTYAGTTNPVYNMDGVPATAANISTPQSVAMDIYGNVIIPDFQNFRIRSIGNHGLETKQNEASTDFVTLVPNPNRGAFVVKGALGSGADENISIEVTDMVGHVVYKGIGSTQKGRIDEPIALGDNLTNGIYLLMVRSKDENTVVRFMVQK